MDQRYIIALELSGSQVKGAAAVASATPNASLDIPSVVAIATDDKVNCVQYGRVQNLIEAEKSVETVLKKLENHTNMQGAKIHAAYVAIAGRSLGSVRTTAELTLPAESIITEEIENRLLVEASKTIGDDKKVLAVIPRKYVVDNQVNNKLVGTMGTRIKGEFTVVTCSGINRRNQDMVIKDRTGLNVREYVVTPLAVANLVLGEEEKQIGCALVDIGAQTTTVSVYKDRVLQYLATLPLGSNNITRDIAIGLNITNERAEMAKCNQGNALAEASSSALDETARINCYVQARVGEIVANIMAQIGYAGYKPADLAAGLVITGRGANLKNFVQFIENNSKMHARKAAIPATVNVVDRTVAPSDYTSLIAIVAEAAKMTDREGCATFPQVEEKEHDPESIRIGTQYDPYNDPDNDQDWDLDDDEAEARKQKAAAKREKEQTAAEKKQREEEKKQAAKENKKRSSILSSLRERMAKIMDYDPENDDSTLDDE